ncbi:MAG: hypothetical protein IIC72_10490 [Acidobacteria bacterium]|nr:hypothetical protein [Acidobacteriota bacterium]
MGAIDLMSQIETQRKAAMMTFTDTYGMAPDVAAKAAMALHPLDDSPVPSRGFEKQVRKASRQYAKALSKLKGRQDEAADLTMMTLRSYKEMAVETGETYYITRYDKNLDI